MSTKTLILAGSRILEIWALFSVSRSPHSAVDSITVRSLSTPVLSLSLPPTSASSPCRLLMRCSSSISDTKRNPLHGSHATSDLICFPFGCCVPGLVNYAQGKPQACFAPNWLAKCTWHLILKVYKHFNIQKLFFARVKLNNSYYVYKIPSMKNKGLSKLIKKEVLQKS